MTAGDIIISGAISLVVAIAVLEFEAWLPRIVGRLIKSAVRRLPKSHQARYAEEWAAHVAEIPGAAAKLWHATGFVWGAGNMFPRWKRAIQFHRARARSFFAARVITRMMDLTIASMMLLMLAPMFVMVGLALAITDPRPIFLKCYRIGRNGRLFGVLHFRSALVNPTTCDGELIPYSGQRIYTVEHLIRLSSIDELPQLLNVLAGDMSMLGPLDAHSLGYKFKPGLLGQSPVHPKIIAGSPTGISASIVLTIVHYVKAMVLLHLKVLSLVFQRN